MSVEITRDSTNLRMQLTESTVVNHMELEITFLQGHEDIALGWIWDASCRAVTTRGPTSQQESYKSETYMKMDVMGVGKKKDLLFCNLKIPSTSQMALHCHLGRKMITWTAVNGNVLSVIP
ncbi:hypothetical protein Vadar_010694 [Vaccinium darrowii]|uniref:Uncharacterized protein n=1 Tax=Vaccinium darrowii TaxID=229202 RepID=A0ACB7XYB2_9ERIC|nr:hypothetical protein Vadar_010694 [Vaccinium darrowii]